MGITLGSNIAAMRGIRSLDKTTDHMSTVSERLASGMRINKASDDAAGLAVQMSLNAESRIFNTSIRNMNDVISAFSIADSSLNQLQEVLTRLQELATQSANGVYSDEQRTALNDEAVALV